MYEDSIYTPSEPRVCRRPTTNSWFRGVYPAFCGFFTFLCDFLDFSVLSMVSCVIFLRNVRNFFGEGTCLLCTRNYTFTALSKGTQISLSLTRHTGKYVVHAEDLPLASKLPCAQRPIKRAEFEKYHSIWL